MRWWSAHRRSGSREKNIPCELFYYIECEYILPGVNGQAKLELKVGLVQFSNENVLSLCYGAIVITHEKLVYYFEVGY